jgi:hypothetical protein
MTKNRHNLFRCYEMSVSANRRKLQPWGHLRGDWLRGRGRVGAEVRRSARRQGAPRNEELMGSVARIPVGNVPTALP